jgi:glutamate-1-semialdehyde 2,1-aminomutase
LDSGIYIPPSAFESWFITDALSYDDLNYTISAISNISWDI